MGTEIDNSFINNCFTKIYSSSISTKIRNFQFKMVHRIIFSNSKLCKWGLIESDKCDLCKEEVETVRHLFCECKVVKPFWENVRTWVNSQTGINIVMNISEMLLGTPQEIPPVIDLFYTVAKMYIYNCKFNKTQPQMKVFISRVMNIKNVHSSEEQCSRQT